MNLTLKVWRQKSAGHPGEFVTYPAHDVTPDMSFLEMLDVVNEHLTEQGQEPIAFDSASVRTSRRRPGARPNLGCTPRSSDASEFDGRRWPRGRSR